MKDLKVIGKEQVAGYEFTGIEGGFGDGTRGMLVRDIANIHNTTTARVNELINRNLKRFTNGIDIINLRTNDVAIVLNDSGFKRNQINASKYIYLLSERGYSKLLKILEDDTAWDIYDKFVDGYFNMRKHIKEQSLPTDPLSILETTFQAIKKQNEELGHVDTRVVALEDFKKDYDENRQIDEEQVIMIEKARKSKAMKIVGGIGTNAYKEFYSDILRKKLFPDFRKHFNVNRYRSLKAKDFDEALAFIQNWNPEKEMLYAIKYSNAQTSLDIKQPA
ncbi:ORF6C domain-containing protein [Leuconostoc falkenbergense]|uniref:ORF6C domain-containing protein n=1 Tax=Leuconostoc falkenbergense TaxID=2766470 RepID=UPI0019682D5D|nr:ORF6C domain-containing protein [Leuconostoc falkenbergense]QSB50728.1 ORF6C domain-containing protein [Leuconostoc falkenbergense]